jgi:transcriptional regulator with XRE-family HTH domain
MEDRTNQFNFLALGQAIKKARTDKGWTRDDLAGMLSLTPRYLVDIENEGQHPSLQVLFSLVTLFDISVDQFFFPDKGAIKDSQRRQLDTLLDGMDSRDITIMTGTAKGIQEANETGE